MLRKFLIALLFIPVSSLAQNFRSTLIFSAEQGDAFFVYLNGQKQNAAAQANVTIHGLDLPYYDVRIEFLNSSIKPVEKKNVAAADSDDKPMQVTYKVRKDKAGKARLSFYAMLPPVSQPETSATVPVTKTEAPVAKPDTVATKTLFSNVSGATISLPVKGEPEVKKDSVLTASVVVKKETPAKQATKVETVPEKPAKAIAAKPDEKKPVVPVKSGTVTNLPPLKKCNDWPLMKEEFQKIKQQLIDVKDESAKLAKSKSLSAANCLLVSQVSEVAALFSTDSKKLDFVMHAYSATIDRPNFDRLRKLFSDPVSVKNFDKFLQSR